MEDLVEDHSRKVCYRSVLRVQLITCAIVFLIPTHSATTMCVQATLTQVFQFLGLDTELSEDAWENILDLGVANHNNKSSFEVCGCARC